METAPERRKRKLISLINEHGVKRIADRAGLNWQSLDQVAKGHKNEPKNDGTQSAKNLGDPSARAIETALGLGIGWFDVDDQAASYQAAPRALTQLEELALKTLARFPSDEARLDALYELNKALTRMRPALGEHNPHGRGLSLHGELEEAPSPSGPAGREDAPYALPPAIHEESGKKGEQARHAKRVRK